MTRCMGAIMCPCKLMPAGESGLVWHAQLAQAKDRQDLLTQLQPLDERGHAADAVVSEVEDPQLPHRARALGHGHVDERTDAEVADHVDIEHQRQGGSVAPKFGDVVRNLYPHELAWEFG